MYIEISFEGFSDSRNRSCAQIRLDMPSCTGPPRKDPSFQQPAEDVIGAFAPAGLFDDHRDKGVHVVLNGIAHRCLLVSSPRNIAKCIARVLSGAGTGALRTTLRFACGVLHP